MKLFNCILINKQGPGVSSIIFKQLQKEKKGERQTTEGCNLRATELVMGKCTSCSLRLTLYQIHKALYGSIKDSTISMTSRFSVLLSSDPKSCDRKRAGQNCSFNRSVPPELTVSVYHEMSFLQLYRAMINSTNWSEEMLQKQHFKVGRE